MLSLNLLSSNIFLHLYDFMGNPWHAFSVKEVFSNIVESIDKKLKETDCLMK